MASEDAPKTAHRIELTRAALYILEGCLQQPGPATTNPKVVLYAKVWDKLNKANNHKVKVSWAPEGHDLDKAMFPAEGESQLSIEKRKVEWNEAVRAWEDEEIVVTMNDKMRDACRDVVEWIHSHRDDAKVPVKLAGKHASSLLIGLGICKPEKDEDFEIEIKPAAAAAPAQAAASA